MYFSKQFYKKGLALSAKHGFNPPPPPSLIIPVYLQFNGGDWRFYDQQFRHLRQSNSSEMPWGSTHWELWIRAQNFYNSPRFTKNITVRNSSAPYPVGSLVPKGYCRNFHRGNDCPGCSLRHQCFKCGVVHLASRCNFRSSKSALVRNRPLQNRELPIPVQLINLNLS